MRYSNINTKILSVREQENILSAAREIVAARAIGGTMVASASAAKQVAAEYMGGRDSETFACIFLSAQNQVIDIADMFHGTINQSPVFPREIAKKALAVNAASVILMHNHPSGIDTPSRADKEITNCIVDALNLLDIRVLDHMIVGNTVYSFANNGLL